MADNFIMTDEQYKSGFMLDEYKNSYSLVAARQYDKDGELQTAKEWAFPQDKERKPRAKAIPVKIELGPKDIAIKRLRQVLALLNGEPCGPEEIDLDTAQGDGSGDIPF